MQGTYPAGTTSANSRGYPPHLGGCPPHLVGPCAARCRDEGTGQSLNRTLSAVFSGYESNQYPTLPAKQRGSPGKIWCQMHAFRQYAMPHPILRLQPMMGQAGCVVLCNYCRCLWQGGVICIRPLTGQTGRIMAAGRETLWRSMQLSRGMGVTQRIHTEPNHPSGHLGGGTWKRLFHLNYCSTLLIN